MEGYEEDPDLRIDGASEPGVAKSDRGRRCPECRGRKQLPGMVKTTQMGSAYGPCPTWDGLGYVPDEIDE
jgi:hypothetical protein